MTGRTGYRKIAANYVYCAVSSLVRNGYVELRPEGVEVVDTGGCIREIAGLEFYGGLLVPDYLTEYAGCLEEGQELLPFLDKVMSEREGIPFHGVALVEGADLKGLSWRHTAVIRRL